MFLRGVHGVFHRFEKQFWVRFFAPYLLLSKASWAPFWPLSGRNLAKRGLAGPLWMTMNFLAPGPLFAFQTAEIFQKGVWQRFFQDWLQTRSFCQLRGPFLITQRSSFVKKGSGSLFFKLAWSSSRQRKQGQVRWSGTPFWKIRTAQKAKRGPAAGKDT